MRDPPRRDQLSAYHDFMISATREGVSMSEQEAPPPMNIYQRINEVRKSVSYVVKKSTVSGAGGGYKAVTHDDVTAALHAGMVECGIVCIPSVEESSVSNTGASTKSGTPIIRYEARFLVQFINVDKPGDNTFLKIDAHALDMGDKAPGKALSMATKYAMLKVFSIATGEDEEQRIDQKAADRADQRVLRHNAALRDNMIAVQMIKDGLREGADKSSAAEVYAELTREEVEALYLAPSKGGIFTTAEREIMKSDAEFHRMVKEHRDAHGWHDNPENTR